MKEIQERLCLLYEKTDDNPLYNEFIAESLGKKPLMRKYTSVDGNKLFYLGFQHTTDLDNPQLIFLKDKFDRFLHESQHGKKVVFIEAKLMHKPGWNYKDEDEAIEHYESGLIYYLATKKKISVMCVQPTTGDEIEFLRSHGVEENVIILYELGRSVFSFYRQATNKKPSLEDVKKNIDEVWDRKKKHFPKALQQIVGRDIFCDVYKNIYGKEFIGTDEQYHDSLGSLQSALGDNTVGVLINRHTELYMLSKIEEYISQGYNIFCVYGAGHLLRQERVLSSMFKSCEDM